MFNFIPGDIRRFITKHERKPKVQSRDTGYIRHKTWNKDKQYKKHKTKSTTQITRTISNMDPTKKKVNPNTYKE